MFAAQHLVTIKMSNKDVATVAYTLACMKDLHWDLEHRKQSQIEQSRRYPGMHMKSNYSCNCNLTQAQARFFESRDHWQHYRVKEAIALVKLHGAHPQDVERRPEFQNFVIPFRQYLKESDNPKSPFYISVM